MPHSLRLTDRQTEFLDKEHINFSSLMRALLDEEIDRRGYRDCTDCGDLSRETDPIEPNTPQGEAYNGSTEVAHLCPDCMEAFEASLRA